MATRKRSASEIYSLRVELHDIDPPIWRSVLVPAAISLPRLHDILQVVMGWTDSHLHSFQIGAREYTAAGDSELEELDMLNEESHKLNTLLKEKNQYLNELLGENNKAFRYLYDFGDSWNHLVIVDGSVVCLIRRDSTSTPLTANYGVKAFNVSTVVKWAWL
jgi:Plasmid pRiA4b ORF-3-like protein